MADFTRTYTPTEWSDNESPAISAANLNHIEDYVAELDDRTRDLQAKKVNLTSDFATRAEVACGQAEEDAESAAASATAAATSATQAAASATAASQAVSGLDTRVTGLEGRVTTLESTVGTVNDTLNALYA